MTSVPSPTLSEASRVHIEVRATIVLRGTTVTIMIIIIQINNHNNNNDNNKSNKSKNNNNRIENFHDTTGVGRLRALAVGAGSRVNSAVSLFKTLNPEP